MEERRRYAALRCVIPIPHENGNDPDRRDASRLATMSKKLPCFRRNGMMR
jgi:hypothetical protein